MIDTDKYEGHIPGPWEIYGERICSEAAITAYLNVGGDVATVLHECNTQLIADAPLLLAEVKRLRQLIKDIGDSSKGNDEYIQARIKEELE